MGESTITIIAIFLAAILMFVFPLVAVTQQGDDVSQLSVQTAVSEFVNSAATKGYIAQTDYDKLTATLGATGNTYNIEIEVQKLDENPGKKTTVTSGDLIGENVSYSVFTNTILAEMSAVDASGNIKGKYKLKQGDNILVKVNNTNTTLAQLMRNFSSKITGNGESAVTASASALATRTGN